MHLFASADVLLIKALVTLTEILLTLHLTLKQTKEIPHYHCSISSFCNCSKLAFSGPVIKTQGYLALSG